MAVPAPRRPALAALKRVAGRSALNAGLLAIPLALGTGGVAPANGQSIDGSTLRFEAAQTGTPLQGRFTEFRAQVLFDPAQPKAGAVHARVVLGSVDAGASAANMLLRSGGFFDAVHYPEATFDASEFTALGGARFRANGTFVLKGHTASLPVDFTTTRDAGGLWFDGNFTISRLAFSVGQGEWADTGTLDDAVIVRFHLRQDGGRPAGGPDAG